MVLSLMILSGCVRDSMEGDWEGDLFCNNQEYEVVARFIEEVPFEYSGQMLFSFSKDVEVNGMTGVFEAELLYEFTTVQTETSGGQDIYLDMKWDKVNCKTDYSDGTTQEGACLENGGINTSTKGDKIGFVEMRYSGSDRITIDDDNCSGYLEID